MYELGFSVSEIYICKQCSYRSTDMRKMKKHVQKHRDAEGKE